MTKALKAACFTCAGIVLLALAASCGRDPRSVESDSFDRFLRERTGNGIGSAPSIYLLLDGTGCQACCVDLVGQLAAVHNFKRALVSTSLRYAAQARQLGYRDILIDSTARLQRLAIAAGGATLIETLGGRVAHIARFSPRNVDSFDSVITDWTSRTIKAAGASPELR